MRLARDSTPSRALSQLPHTLLSLGGPSDDGGDDDDDDDDVPAVALGLYVINDLGPHPDGPAQATDICSHTPVVRAVKPCARGVVSSIGDGYEVRTDGRTVGGPG